MDSPILSQERVGTSVSASPFLQAIILISTSKTFHGLQMTESEQNQLEEQPYDQWPTTFAVLMQRRLLNTG